MTDRTNLEPRATNSESETKKESVDWGRNDEDRIHYKV